ncbi:hypothetical protein P3102_05105 [Amycolatopsis sp. QT-25]|uniref:hypothetical protein n=1 Tax=Amycolatopsis sp. QT-25 TaxID=3034022 RepID=UPI0023ED64DF|nr:hypothetical protein [Amycolatopsis sp. QT-25]WET80630.1 hypothetical protein P3102_05105 [Amycolatopsis sp. QT-25]
MSSPDTEQLTTTPPPTERNEPAAPQGGRFWRGLTGSLAAGMAVLTVCVVSIAAVCLFIGAPGPGLLMLIGHPAAAVLALLAQRTVDRRTGRVAGFAGLGVVVSVTAALSLFWWS